jgi:hypothetical protein
MAFCLQMKIVKTIFCNIVYINTRTHNFSSIVQLLMFISGNFGVGEGGPEYMKIIPFIFPVYMHSSSLFESANFINTSKNFIYRIHNFQFESSSKSSITILNKNKCKIYNLQPPLPHPLYCIVK